MDLDGMPSHHLLPELKAEAAWAKEEYDAAANQLAAIEKEFNDALYHAGDAAVTGDTLASLLAEREKREEAIRIDVLCDMQAMAARRRRYMEAAYAIASANDRLSTIVMKIRDHVLFSVRAIPATDVPANLHHAVYRLAVALHAYCQNAPSDAADEEVRCAMHDVETLFCGNEKHKNNQRGMRWTTC